MSMSTFMALVPDHPMFEKWREHAAAYAEYKAGTQVAPGGGYFEYGVAYHIHGAARTTNALPGLAAIGAPNLQRLYRFFREDWDYYMNLLTPVDPRWKARMIPGMANSPPGNSETLADVAGALAAYDPEFASQALWAWQANGANVRENAILLPVHVEPKEPELRSRIFPGVGVIFRAHQGPEETYMLVRSGFQWSHWYVDPGHFILCSRGVPLVPFQPYQYWWSPNKAFDMYNSMRFGHPENLWPHGWGDCNILDYAFGPTVDYAWSSTGFPDWFVSPGASEEWREKSDAPVTQVEGRLLAEGFEQKQGAFEWNRQVLFLKGKTARSPNYVVFRDTMPGDGKLASFLFLNLLGRQSDVKADGDRLHVDTEWPTKMDVFFPHPGKISPEFFEERQPIAFYNTNLSARLGKDAPCPRNWVEADGSPVKQLTGRHGSNTHEQHVFLRLPGKPGEGYFWVIYPRGEAEPAPTVTRLADGVLKIAHPEGTDYVLVGTGLTKFEGEDVTLEGSAAAVRVRPDVVTLALTGGAGRVGYKGWVAEGIAPFERSVPVSQLRPGTERVPVPPSAISWDAPDPDDEKVAEGVWVSHLLGDVTTYIIDSPTPVVLRHGDLTVEARKARISVDSGAGVHFEVPEPLYAKLTVRNVGVRGVGPFSLSFTPGGITGKVDGRMRSIVTTWPSWIVRPMYRMDGVRYCAGWADDHSIAKGTDTPQFAIGFGVSDGPHRVEISEWAYPPLPPTPQP
jgi:hypothetical protein